MMECSQGAAPPRVVILGGGFGGLYAALALKHAPVQVTLIDQHNYHLFQPLLYQVATAGLSPGDIAYPIRAVVRRQKNTSVYLGEAVAVDASVRKVILKDGEVAYDYLILATGASHSYFGHADWEPLAPGLKTLDNALEIRRRILLAFEKAERETDTAKRQAWLTFVVVGGGPTGVELAGAIGEIACKVLTRDFRNITPQEARIILLEGAPRLLPSFPEALSAQAEHSLRKLCVQVRTDALVTSIQPGVIVVGDESIPAATVLWAAGVVASPIARSLGVPLDRAGRVLVQPNLSIPGHPEVFVVGDLAALADESGKPLPGLAPVAIQQGRHAAKNILLNCAGQPARPFHYVDRGRLATIGRAAAVADFGAVRISGFFAWLAWLFIHIFWLIGFRNRFIVLFEWAWAYLTWQRSARLITGDTEKNP
jgi:NADH dehydrogenase